MSEIKTPIEFLTEEYLQELGNGTLSKHASWKHECGVLMSTYDAKQIIDYVNRIKEQNEKLKEQIRQTEAWLSFNTHPDKDQIRVFRNSMIELLKSCES